MSTERSTHVRAWAGAVAGALAWAAHQQVLADLLHFDCGLGHPLTATIAGVVALAAIALGALVSWRVRPVPGPDVHDPPPVRFVCDVSLLAAGLFALPVLLQTFAGFVVPSCVP